MTQRDTETPRQPDFTAHDAERHTARLRFLSKSMVPGDPPPFPSPVKTFQKCPKCKKWISSENCHSTGPRLPCDRPSTGPRPALDYHATGPRPALACHATGLRPALACHATGPRPALGYHATGPRLPRDRRSTGPRLPCDRPSTGTGPRPALACHATGRASVSISVELSWRSAVGEDFLRGGAQAVPPAPIARTYPESGTYLHPKSAAEVRSKKFSQFGVKQTKFHQTPFEMAET